MGSPAVRHLAVGVGQVGVVAQAGRRQAGRAGDPRPAARRRRYVRRMPTDAGSSAVPPTSSATSAIWLRVSVPVLSVHTTVVEPRASTAGRWRMIALRRAIRLTPIARVIVTAAGRPSGDRPDGQRHGRGHHVADRLAAGHPDRERDQGQAEDQPREPAAEHRQLAGQRGLHPDRPRRPAAGSARSRSARRWPPRCRCPCRGSPASRSSPCWPGRPAPCRRGSSGRACRRAPTRRSASTRPRSSRGLSVSRMSAGTRSPASRTTRSPGTSPTESRSARGPATDDPGVGPGHRIQGLQRCVGAGLLDVADGGVDEDHAEDHRGVDRLTEQGSHPGGGQQDVDRGGG